MESRRSAGSGGWIGDCGCHLIFVSRRPLPPPLFDSNGAEGVQTFSRTETGLAQARVAAVPLAPEAIHSTNGAGDTLAAVYCWARFVRGQSHDDALARGMEAAAARLTGGLAGI